MATRPFQYFCVHGHFYQPPRGNPVSNEIGEEADAGDYLNWNERITAESYQPNAQIGNFDKISFDVGLALMSWLKRYAPDTYERIVRADKLHVQKKEVGNALGSPYHDVLMPLLTHRHKITELYWGWMAFQHHYGRTPRGIWLPELAIDHETLRLIAAMGYEFTIVAQGQVKYPAEGSGPFWVDLGNGQKIAVFVRNDELSNDLSFNIRQVGGAGHWARNKLADRRHKGLLTLLATDGETFGHHHLGEELFLHWLTEHEAPAIGYKVVTLDEFLQTFPPRDFIELKPFTSWSNPDSMAAWTSGPYAWKAALLRAFDHLDAELTEIYLDTVKPLGIDPEQLLKDYIRVELGEIKGKPFMAEHTSGLKSDVEARILALLQAKMYMGRSYTSNAFFFDDFTRRESRYAIANAAAALQTVQEFAGTEIADRFRNDLCMLHQPGQEQSGATIYDSVVEEFFVPKSEEEMPQEESSED